MTIYNFNLGIGWASSGVEYAQAYRANVFRKLKKDAKFVFTEMILNENIEYFTSNIGFLDNEVIWLYLYFTDFKIAPTTYTTHDLVNSFSDDFDRQEKDGDIIRYFFDKKQRMVTAYLKAGSNNIVQRAEFVSKGKLIRKDYYINKRFMSEYFAPKDNQAHLYARHFFDQDGSLSYQQIIDGQQVIFRFPNKIIYSEQALLDYFLDRLALSEDDVLIVDRGTNMAQQILKASARCRSKVGVVVHAEHFSENMTDDNYILWNNFYEYQFEKADQIDFFIVATARQKEILTAQLKKYEGIDGKVFDIPVGSIDQLKKPLDDSIRKPFSIITASRLADEKHIDWAIESVVTAHKKLPQITFDIYGGGSQMADLKKLIDKLHASDYIRLLGHQDLSDLYQKYQLYLSTSTSEGFGLTLLEAVGSGLPIIGFDVRYGNQTFIDNGENGFLIKSDRPNEQHYDLDIVAKTIVYFFSKCDFAEFSQHSYAAAEDFLTSRVEKKWDKLLRSLND
ncbi:accessory Sec system glycosyltransferase GtfA [Oenococcus alcoholitolerans]|uniref:accessory Sec system glycosyltransferase GtfA n=1 Tax=Oenococcus alcoholitolerans TaxID=931074 RepID=UPI003F7131FF